MLSGLISSKTCGQSHLLYGKCLWWVKTYVTTSTSYTRSNLLLFQPCVGQTAKITVTYISKEGLKAWMSHEIIIHVRQESNLCVVYIQDTWLQDLAYSSLYYTKNVKWAMFLRSFLHGNQYCSGYVVVAGHHGWQPDIQTSFNSDILSYIRLLMKGDITCWSDCKEHTNVGATAYCTVYFWKYYLPFFRSLSLHCF